MGVHRAIILTVTLLAAAEGAAAQTGGSPIVPPERLDQMPARPSPQQQIAREEAKDAATPEVTPFTLRTVQVQGSSLSTQELEAAYKPYIGSTATRETLQQIADSITQRYNSSDIALYTILVPEQDFAGGVLRVEVVEGFVSGIQLKRDADGRLVRAYASRLESKRPLPRSTLQRQVSLIRDVPGLTTEMQFLTGDERGAVDLAIDGHQRPIQLGLGINNRGTAFLGRTQVQTDLYLNGLLTQGSQTRLTAVVPIEADLFQYVSGSHTQPLNTYGTTLQATAGYLRTRPDRIPIKGNAKSVGLQISHPVIRSYRNNFYVSLGVDGLNSDNALLGQTISDEHTRAVRAAASFSRSTSESFWLFSGTLSSGIKALGAQTTATAASKLNFRKLNLRALYNRRLARDFLVRLDGVFQLTSDRLPASEQISLGGDQFGRGYPAAIIAGDRGYAGLAEVAFAPTDLPARLTGSELYGFVDRGRVRRFARGTVTDASLDVASAGAGIRLLVAKKFRLGLELTRALRNPLPDGNQKQWRGIFMIQTLL